FFRLFPKEGSFRLKYPCFLNCETESYAITLLINPKNPSYLLVLIDGEIRRCIDISEDAPSLKTRDDVIRFLYSWRNSPAFREIVDNEESMDREWDAL
ncbi:MAG: hypothetical protein ACP5I1_15790, partial [Candidatus Hinthialibacter sp.]